MNDCNMLFSILRQHKIRNQGLQNFLEIAMPLISVICKFV